MKEHKIDKKHCIGGWYIDKKICDELVENFKKTPNFLKQVGVIGRGSKLTIDKERKDSLEILINNKNDNYPLNVYQDELQKCLDKFQEKFDVVKGLQRFNLSPDGYNLQAYLPKGGFKSWHCERTGPQDMERILVFMTYLNDVPDGGTLFKYQKIKIPAKKGLTIIWPSDWTHTHKGEISKKHNKYIVTGWYTFNKENE